jgi:hypothetical protein
MKTLQKSLLALTLCSLPLVAYAASKNVRVTVDNQPTNYRAIIVDGTTYIALRDVADLTGREVSYNSRRGVVNISGGGERKRPVGGTTQRSGEEGVRGQWLTIPEVSLRINGVNSFRKYGTDLTEVAGTVRNTSNTQRAYNVSDARLVLKDGTQLTFQLSSNELGGSSYARLQRGEETSLKLQFKGRFSENDIDRVVITLHVGEYSGGPKKVLRVNF